ncbi:MAG: hypothetical protein L6427_07820, partial [Actinomycetia bacterium]|nr:hypothetical protein [Actinomycetes bacterium]
TAGTAQAINENPGFLKSLLGYLDIDKLNRMTSDTWAWTAQVVGKLDPAVIAGIVNANGTFVTQLVGKLDPDALAQGMNSDPSFMKKLVGKLNPRVIAAVINNNETFLSRLMPKLDPASTAQAINENVPFVTSLVSNLNPKVIAGVMNNTSDSTSELMKYLNPKIIAYVVNQNGSFVSGLLSSLKPKVITTAINNPAAQPFLNEMLDPSVGMDPAVMAAAQNANPEFTLAMMEPYPNGIDPAVLAYVVNNNQAFITGLISYLDAGALNLAMRNATKLSYQPPVGPPVGMFYDLTKPPPAGLDPVVIAYIINNNEGFLEDLMGGMNPVTTATALNSVNGKRFINDVVTALKSSDQGLTNLAAAMADPDAIEMSRLLMIALSDNAALTFLRSQLNAQPMANNALSWVVMKLWSDNSSLSSPYMFGVFREAVIMDMPSYP